MRFSQQIVQILSIIFLLLHLSCKSDSTTTQQATDAKPKQINSTPESSKKLAVEEETTWEEVIEEVEESKPVVPEPAKKAVKKAVKKPTPPKKKKTPKKKIVPKKQMSKIVFEEFEFDFGNIKEGDTITHKFVFKNESKVPLEVISADATCGCTRPSFPFIPIENGEEGYIGVQYISINKEGYQKPEITVKSNGSAQPITLNLTGYVEPKPKEDETAVRIDSIIPKKLLNKGN